MTITDNLAQVLKSATVVPGSLKSSVGGAPALSGTTLRWSGKLSVGAAVVLTYQVKVSDGVSTGTVIKNVAHGSATPPGGPAVVPPDSTTEHPVVPAGGTNTPPTSPNLASTGVESGWLSVAGAALFVAGLMLVIGFARRRRT